MKKAQLVLAILLLLVTINSTNFFLNVLKVKPLEWLIFNACAPSSITFLLGYIIYLATRNRLVQHIAVLPMLFFGGLGLFVFPWSGFNIIGQISHVIMVLNVFLLLMATFRQKDYKTAVIGLLFSMVIFSPMINYHQTYVATHPERTKEVLGLDLSAK